jgi:hypothetical protein
MRKLLTFFFLLCFSASAEAGPIEWVKHHPVATSFIAGGVAATVHGIGLYKCREHGVENCQAKYGSAWISYSAVTVTNFAVISATSSCWKNESGKFCSLFAYGGSAAQLGFGINQWRKGSDHAKDDLRLSALLRHQP